MSKEVRASPITVRLENLNFLDLITNLQEISNEELAITPYSLTVYVNGYPVTLNLTYSRDGRTSSIAISCEESATLQTLIKAIQQFYGAPNK
jgi:hypothetical protein